MRCPLGTSAKVTDRKQLSPINAHAIDGDWHHNIRVNVIAADEEPYAIVRSRSPIAEIDGHKPEHQKAGIEGDATGNDTPGSSHPATASTAICPGRGWIGGAAGTKHGKLEIDVEDNISPSE
jgi:hypothetical protein